MSIWSDIEEKVKAAVTYGWHRAHKYVDEPTPEAIAESIVEHVMEALMTSLPRFSLDLAAQRIAEIFNGDL